jgi:hypothetical protein
MTERLTALMTAEADLLDVPPAPTATVLTRGRTLRRRRRGAQLGTGLAALALVAGVGLAVTSGSDDRRDALDPSGSPSAGADAPDLGAVFAIGPDVHLTGVDVVADIDDVTVKSMYYTSAGVLVRHGDNSYSDGGGPQRFSLVGTDGVVTPLALVTEGIVHATDPSQPYVVYVDRPDGLDGVAVLHVRDVTTDSEVATVDLPEATEGYSPASLDGDTVYVRNGSSVLTVDWREATVGTSDTLTSEVVAGGHAIEGYGEDPTVVDVATGRTLLSADLNPDAYGYFSLSPDGASAVLFVDDDTFGSGGASETTAYDVETGATLTVPGASYDYGWTSAGDLFRVSEPGIVTTCVVSTGECAETDAKLDVLPDTNYRTRTVEDDLVLGGVTRES